MHITELRLAGFKSFVDGARAPIEPGLTGVVGPNGCGKSNLLEAVRWVMGAASAKAMRAADMDDVIFAGSAGRPAREHAEVTLVLADALGKAPAPFHTAETLEISRRIRRGLGSTYRLNGKEVRAKDVQLLFADAATGANSPALVRQGQISELINSKPENRRRILEDAAGVAGLHARRHEADLKLKAAETNLTRLEEVLTEIEAQAQSLKKQARQAERYRGLAQTLRETEALLLHRRWSEARNASAEAEGRLREAERAQALAAEEASKAERSAEVARETLPPLREEEAVSNAVLRRLEGVRVGLERDLAEADAALARADADLRRAREESERLAAHDADAQAALQRLTQDLAALGAEGEDAKNEILAAARAKEQDAVQKRQATEAELERLASESAARRARAEALRGALQNAEAAKGRAAKRKADMEALIALLPKADALSVKAETARANAETAQQASSDIRAKLNNAEAALKKAEADDEAAWSPYRAAETAFKSLEAEVKALEKLSPPEGAKFPPVLASIDVEPGYERALAAALGDDLDASLNAEALARWSGAENAKALLPEGTQALSDFVKAPPALHPRLSLCGVVAQKDGARVIKKASPGVRLVSIEGDLWRWDGFVRAAQAPQPAAARLEHKTRLAKARKELDASEKKFAKAHETWENAKARRKDADQAARVLRMEAPKLAAKAAEAVRIQEMLNAEVQRNAERRAELNAQAVQANAEAETADTVLKEARTAQAESETPQDDAPLNEARAAVEAARAEAARLSADAAAIEREQKQRAARRAAIAAESEQWTRRSQESAARIKALKDEIVKIETARKAAMDAPDKAREALAKLGEEAASAEERRKRASDKVAEAETAQRLSETEARAKEQAHSAAREQRAGAEAHVQAAAARLEDIAAHALEQTGQEPEHLAGLAGALLTGSLGTSSIQEIEKRFERLKSERDAAGPVNLRAEEELAEAEARLQGLIKEKDDVAAGVAKLRGAITRLNNEGRARLLAAFEIVEGHFAQLFAALFEGGQAALKLTENEDPLNAGLEIYAQPPGKRLSTLSLMSGGEQALTATALIFAVFLANPAPLCVLDEVDAPLDDANVDRFCRLLEEMRKLTTTRFIVITHNPVTMSRMDRLYGVTMQEQGVSQLVSVDLARAQALAAS